MTATHGHCLEVLAAMPAGSARCCVTSPPYWGLRDYGTPPVTWPAVTFAPMAGLALMTIPEQEASLGLEPDPWAYVGHLVSVFREVRRVLVEDGSLWLNLGDSYVANGGGSERRMIELGRPSQNALSKPEHLCDRKRSSQVELKPKDLLGIPWRVAFALQADGWWLRSDVVWAKPNPMPESVTDRPTKAHEMVFLLAKSERYYFGQEAVRQEQSPESIARRGRGDWRGKEGWSEAYHGNPPKGLARQSTRPVDAGANIRSVWTIATEPCPDAHFAVMPSALAERCILAGSEVDDVVLDPFAGAGTTLATARRLGRRGVGSELNPEYIDIQERRIEKAGGWQVPLLKG